MMAYRVYGLYLAVAVLLLCCIAETSAARWVRQDYLPHALRELPLTEMEAVSELVDIDRVYEALFTPIQIPRVVGSDGHRQVREFLLAHFRGLGGWRVDVDEFAASTPHGSKTFTNLVFTLDPYAPRRLVLAAHYDSKYFAQGRFVGATDSAMPCAMLLHLAEILDPLLKQSIGGNVTLSIVFFDGEEAFEEWTDDDSIYGAKHLAAAMQAQRIPRRPPAGDASHGDTGSLHGDEGYSARREDEAASDVTVLQATDALVLIDLIGHKNPRIYWSDKQVGHLFARLVQLERVLTLAGALDKDSDSDAAYFVRSDDALDLGVGDDHTPFQQLGVPILHLISMPFPPFWHNARDNESVIDKPATANLLKMLAVLLCEYLHLAPDVDEGVEA